MNSIFNDNLRSDVPFIHLLKLKKEGLISARLFQWFGQCFVVPVYVVVQYLTLIGIIRLMLAVITPNKHTTCS